MGNPNPNFENLRPPWEKGQSGNPSGNPKGYLKLSTILQQRLAEGDNYVKLIDRLIKIATSDTSKENDSLSAIGEILDRLEGKAVAKVENAITFNDQIAEIKKDLPDYLQ
jgi:hypothetical protein